MAVCRRYLGNGPDAEDTLMESFMKVFSKVETFNEAGSFEGWIRRIVVNESLMKIRKQTIRESLSNFQGAEHRLEKVLKIQDVQYINDSKATNVNSVFYALDSMTTPTVWIVGGVDKGNDYDELMPLVREKVKAIVCLGVDNSKIINAFNNVVDVMVETSSMSEAVQLAQRLAEKGDSVLLSPACASFDLFENYEDRGRQFKQAIFNL